MGADAQADDDEHLRALEEQWLESFGSASDEPSGDSETHATLFVGVCLGFFFPFAPLILIQSDLLSRRAQHASVFGLIFNIVTGTFCYLNT